MSDYLTRPLAESDISDVAEFLARSVDDLRRSDGLLPRTAEKTPGERARDLKNRLFANPFAGAGLPVGWVLLDDRGSTAGAFLAYPWQYRFGDRTLRALSGGPFFVDPTARMRGLLLFRKFLDTPGLDFWYSTTCNERAGGLWSRSGGAAVPGSDLEYFVVFRAGPVLQEAMLRRGARSSLTALAGFAGAFTRLLTWRGRSRCRVTQTRDWSRLAAVAERSRNPKLLTSHRSVEYLQWTYGGMTRHDAPEVYQFLDSRGREGWFALKRVTRGRANQIRSAQLLDAVWPHDEMGFESVLPAIIDAASAETDLLSIRPRGGVFLKPRHMAVLHRSLPAPEAFIITRTARATDLSSVADFANADAM